jgi:hypothetical protein
MSEIDFRMSRRQMLKRFASGFGMLGVAGLCAEDFLSSAIANAVTSSNPLALQPPPYPAKAKRVIFLFMSGGPSHVDTFDPKPQLVRHNGTPLPFEKPKLERTKTGNLLQSPWKFEKHGQAGIEVSELFPQLATCVDDMCIIRSMVADNINHNGACLQMNTGEQAFSRPSLGSWLLYGLGSENQNLPGVCGHQSGATGARRAVVGFKFSPGGVSRHPRFRFEKSHREFEEPGFLEPTTTHATQLAQGLEQVAPSPTRGGQPIERAHRIV